jgi:hypothetical protein
LDPPILGHMQRIARKTVANSEKGKKQPSASSFPLCSKDNKTLLHRGRAASWSNHVSIHALFFINDIGRYRFKPKQVGGSIASRQPPNLLPES